MQRSNAHGFPQYCGAVNAPVRFQHPLKRLFQKNVQFLQLCQFRLRVWSEHGASQSDVELPIGFLLAGNFLCEGCEFLSSLLRLSFPEGNHGSLLLDVELVDGAFRHLKGAVIFLASALEITHQRPRIAEALLRGQERRINVQRRSVVFQGSPVIADDSGNFSERIFWIVGFLLYLSIAPQRSQSFSRVGIARTDIQVTEAIQSRREIRIDLECGLEQGSRMIVILLNEEPLSGEVQDVLVPRETLP